MWYGIYYPYTVFRSVYPSRAGFAQTRTDYLPTGGSNFPAFQLQDGFPSPPIQPQGAKLGPGAFLGQSTTLEESDGSTPMAQQWSLSMQQALGGSWVFDATYSGNKGTHFWAGSYDYNELDPQFLSLGLALQDQVPNPFAGLVPGALGAPTITRRQSLRPFPYYSNIGVLNPHLGDYISHLFSLRVEKRMSRGLALLFSFSTGKLISNSLKTPVNFGAVEQVGVNGFQNGKFDRRQNRSVDPTDVSARGVVSVLYELPLGSGKAVSSSSGLVNKLIGGWQINTIGTIQSGNPVIISGASNFAADRPNSTGKSAKLGNRTAAQFFDTSQFVNPPDFTFGNVGRSLPDVRKPGVVNWDLSLIKNTRIRERLHLQFRAEAFNFLNHLNLKAPGTGFVPGADGKNRSGSFGVVTTARDARQIQFALKLIF